MAYRLKINQGNNVQIVELPNGKISTTPNTTYQVLSESGEVLSQEQLSNLKLEGDDLYIYLDGSAEPSFVLENYTKSFPIDNLHYLEKQPATFATAVNAVVAQELSSSVLASEVTMAAKVGLGILAAGGLAIWLKNRDNDGSSASNSPNKSNEQPVAVEQNVEPEQTVTPVQPTVSEQPSTPAQPATPEQPATPNQPTAPEQPATPNQPTVPEQPATPNQPTAPEQPATPNQPTVPEQPATPNQPTVPERPPVPELILSVTLDPISTDNIINATEANEKITVSGALSANLPLEQANVEILLNGKTYLANLSADRTAFQIDIDGINFANNSTITVNANGSNGESKGVATTMGEYQYDVTLPAVEVTIASIATTNTVNFDASKNTQQIVGALSYADDVDPATVKVNVEINQKVYDAIVEGKQWSLDINGSELAFAEGTQQIKVTASASDNAGNIGNNEATQDYFVDTIPPEATIKLNPIDLDNKVPQDATDNIVISGVVEGDFQPNSTVIINIAQQIFEATVAENGEFNVDVPASALINNTGLQVTATLNNQDNVGNVKEVTAQQDYAVVIGDIHIALNNITGQDSLINVTEAQSDKTIISGKIWGDDASSNSVVTLQMNGKSFTANVVANLTFTVEVNTDDLKTNDGYKVIATAMGSNNAKASVEHVYDISPEVVAKVDITHIDDFALSQTETTRLSGKVNLSGVSATGQNPYSVKEIQLSFGGKTYELGVNAKDQTFFVDVPTEELAKASGSEITYKIKATSMFELLTNANGSYTIRNYTFKESDAKLTFDNFVNTDAVANTHKLATISEPTSVISGEVSGVAVAGDKIKVAVGNAVYNTEVKQDNGKLVFSIEVPTKSLTENADKQVVATLMTTDKSGKEISVSDVEVYTVTNTNDAIFVNPHTAVTAVNVDHTSANYNLPYFIDRVNWGSPSGYHAKTPYGGDETPLVVKYAFVSAQDAKTIAPPQNQGSVQKDNDGKYVYLDFQENTKNTIRGAYQKIEEYLNVKFVEVTDPTEATSGVQHYYTTLTGNFEYASAMAWNGGDFIWNTGYDGGPDYAFYTALHELTHTLQMNHNENYNVAQDQYIAKSGYAELEATTEFTNMSYNIMGTTQAQRDLRMYDLAFLHYRFGVNHSQRTGDDVYGFRNYNFDSSDGGGMYIWDGNGVDTFDASQETKELHINLTPGSWVYKGSELKANFAVESYSIFDKFKYFDLNNTETVNVQGSRNNNLNAGVKYYHDDQAFIGYGTQIENAVGGSGNDEIIGNKADNNINGGAGDDTLKGGEGNDYLNGGEGADKLFGEADNDIYIIDNNGDVITELSGEGEDTVYSSVDYSLSENVENLILTGTIATSAVGNAQDNTLVANNIGNILNGKSGIDRLIGGLGKDQLTGGDGDDIFVFNTVLNGNADEITDFTVGQDKIELAQTVFNALSTGMTGFNDYIQYDATNGKLSYDQDGTGISDSVHFATLTTGLTIDQSQFIIA
ncbi:Ig-like domain-containing protein [Actinobacillus arthritidis]|uniref:Ig-like domain-containing protein n=1 Tax=Actinobacillus arthritidis TaxID=157339 RepID=UPI0024425B42|nr:Ig-like domain-containing protein [Actinobacillus arthritidis]WGE90182.1 Ig-like domain-containing protein [Actinobacillus arthritidis]